MSSPSDTSICISPTRECEEGICVGDRKRVEGDVGANCSGRLERADKKRTLGVAGRYAGADCNGVEFNERPETVRSSSWIKHSDEQRETRLYS